MKLKNGGETEWEAHTFMWLYPWWWKRNNIKCNFRHLPKLQKRSRTHCLPLENLRIFSTFFPGLAPQPCTAQRVQKIILLNIFVFCLGGIPGVVWQAL
jgi:hypothetical protein